jgi:UDP-N-acetylmuramate--alanine ligase
MPGVTADIVVRGAIRAGAATTAIRERAAVSDWVAGMTQAGDVVLTMGAGDITRVGPEVIQQLEKREGPGKREEGRGKRS